MVDSPQRCILLLEDIDAAFISRNITGGGVGHGGATIGTNVTFSGLLNAIDGVAAQEGRILVMTTNHFEKLDPALIRPGRVDMAILLDLATRHQARELFIQFFPHADDSDRAASSLKLEELEQLAHLFSGAIPEKTLSMAQIQGFLMKYKIDPRGAVQNIGELVALCDDDGK